jgi:transitional endoplasmic reticulum ATPase
MEGVVVLAATNRPDIVDTALLRAGRFDRLILIPAPDRDARLQILKIHTKDMPLDDSVNLEELAERMEGYVGADIEGICREAAILALRENMEAESVGMEHFEKALSKARPSVDEDTIKFYEAIGKELEGGIARREVQKTSGETGYA